MTDDKRLRIIDEATGAELAEMGMAVRPKAVACIDCRFMGAKISWHTNQGHNNFSEECLAFQSPCNQVNPRADCKFFESKHGALAPGSAMSRRVAWSLSLSITAIAMSFLVGLLLLVSCSVDDNSEQERADCESFFAAAEACIDRLRAGEDDTLGTDASSCLRTCNTGPREWCAQWPQNERAEIYAEQLRDDCELFALRWRDSCVGAIGDPDDQVLAWDVRRDLYDACLAFYIDDSPIPAKFDTCAAGPEFTLEPVRLCDAL